MAIPLKLSGREQDLLAELCSALRGWVYQLEAAEDGNKSAEVAVDSGSNDAVLVDKLGTVIDRFEANPQHLDSLYDRLHRTGANG